MIEGKRWLAQFDCDWLQFLGVRKWNWITFRFLSLEAEWERHLGSAEMSGALLGFRCRLSYTYDDDTPMRVELRESIDDWLAGTQVAVPHDEYVALRADAEKWRNQSGAAMRDGAVPARACPTGACNGD